MQCLPGLDNPPQLWALHLVGREVARPFFPPSVESSLRSRGNMCVNIAKMQRRSNNVDGSRRTIELKWRQLRSNKPSLYFTFLNLDHEYILM